MVWRRAEDSWRTKVREAATAVAAVGRAKGVRRMRADMTAAGWGAGEVWRWCEVVGKLVGWLGAAVAACERDGSAAWDVTSEHER